MGQEIKRIETTPVNSSNLKAVGHDASTNTLQVDFHNGAIYQYHPFTAEGYKMLLEADSVGAFFNTQIKTNTLLTVTKVQDKK
mgnify:CR=1 FL=1